MKCPKNPKSRKFRRIINRGCGFIQDYFNEWDCSHKYEWGCDECPINNVKPQKDFVVDFAVPLSKLSFK